jgi:hypothetical protein
VINSDTRNLSRWRYKRQVGAVIVVVSALLGAMSAATLGWVAYADWACRAGWPTVGCAQRELAYSKNGTSGAILGKRRLLGE